MRKKLLILTVVLVLIVSSFALVACDKTKRDIYPAWAYDSVWEDEVEETQMAEGGNIRIMSYNVLVEAWNKRVKTGIKETFDARAEQVSKVILHYSPEVIGLQEADSKWHKALEKNLSGNYVFVDTFKSGSNYTTMMYNTKKVTLVDSGKQKYAERSESKMRFAAWALFEKKDSKDRFIVMNTHFDFGQDRKEMQKSQMKEYGDLAKKLHSEKKVPVFMTGDYNAYDQAVTDKKSPIYEGYQGKDLYDNFANTYKDTFVDSNYIEGIQICDGKNRKYNDAKWDHIFVSKDNIEVLKYVILSNDFYNTASDHYPVFIDAKIGK